MRWLANHAGHKAGELKAQLLTGNEGREIVIGVPRSTQDFTTQQLQDQDIVGVYDIINEWRSRVDEEYLQQTGKEHPSIIAERESFEKIPRRWKTDEQASIVVEATETVHGASLDGAGE